MRIDIWSDFVCPFCYIGKRKLEGALSRFGHRDEIEIVWHSFQLEPDAKVRPGQDVFDYLAEMKGIPRESSIRMHENVAARAEEAGLVYNFDRAIPANTFDAHRLMQMAQANGHGEDAEERLFSAYFTEGRNIGDHETLIEVGADIGLDPQAVRQMLESDAYADDVRRDAFQAQSIGIRGVPFFVIDRKYGVSGAQESDVFLQVLEEAYAEQGK